MRFVHYCVLIGLGISPQVFATDLPIANDEMATQSVLQVEKNRWIDRRHRSVQNWLNRSSYKIDDFFGEVDRSRPATANLRIIVDNQWSEYDDFQSRVRVRGKIKLPTLEKKLSIMIGDDRLDDQSDRQVTVNDPIITDSAKVINTTQTRKENTSLALRISKWNDHLPFDADFDIGLRSYNNLFARLKVAKDWQLSPNVALYTEQTYRYSTKDKNELHSFWDFYHQQNAETRMSWQTNIDYHDETEDDLSWNSRLFRQHQFSKQRQLSYGVQATGYFNHENLYLEDWDLNRWGGFASWRQPLWREWFFIQADVNYMNDKRLNRDHYASANVRLEMLF